MSKEVIAIFDIGKTDKKFILYDVGLQPVLKTSIQLPEAVDEGLFPCEDHALLKEWLLATFAEAVNHPRYKIVGLNFAAYGATMVHLDKDHQPVAPIYNYLKPFDASMQAALYSRYGGRAEFCGQTCSPALGHLNSGLTLYWLRHTYPRLFGQVHCSMHLPEFCSFLFSNVAHSGYTSLGCHTHLWDFAKGGYHGWVQAEGLQTRLAPLQPSTSLVARTFGGTRVLVGMGLHNSSAALLPHRLCQEEPFAFLSTGSWFVTLNPFNNEALTAADLDADCLFYMDDTGAPVRGARYFAGKIHEDMVHGLGMVYEKKASFFQNLAFDAGLFAMAEAAKGLADFVSYYSLPNAAQAYHFFMYSLVSRVVKSVHLAIGTSGIRRLIVAGAFVNNKVFLAMLLRMLADMELIISTEEEPVALGTAHLVHAACFKARWHAYKGLRSL